MQPFVKEKVNKKEYYEYFNLINLINVIDVTIFLFCICYYNKNRDRRKELKIGYLLDSDVLKTRMLECTLVIY